MLTTTAIATSTSKSHRLQQIPFTKQNKLYTTDSFSVNSVDMSTSIGTTMLTTMETSYLPPIQTRSKITATKMSSHHQRHFILQTQGSNSGGNIDIDMAEREHSTSSSTQTVPLEQPLSSLHIQKNENFTPLFTHKMPQTVPSDKINLRLILVSGKTKEFVFNTTDSAGDIAQTVFDNWPVDWAQEAVSKSEILRLIYQGRFLHCNVTLGALGLPLGKTTVMHLVPRDNLPEPNSQDQRLKSKSGSGRCCSNTCNIL